MGFSVYIVGLVCYYMDLFQNQLLGKIKKKNINTKLSIQYILNKIMLLIGLVHLKLSALKLEATEN